MPRITAMTPRRRTDEEIVSLIRSRLVQTTGFAETGPKNDFQKGIQLALETVIRLIEEHRP